MDQRYDDPYSKVNLVRTQSALGFKKEETMRDIVLKSRQMQRNIDEMMKSQRDKKFLDRVGLVPVPKIVTHPTTCKAAAGVQFYRADNEAHCRNTNTGYSRKPGSG